MIQQNKQVKTWYQTRDDASAPSDLSGADDPSGPFAPFVPFAPSASFDPFAPSAPSAPSARWSKQSGAPETRVD